MKVRPFYLIRRPGLKDQVFRECPEFPVGRVYSVRFRGITEARDTFRRMRPEELETYRRLDLEKTWS